MKLRIIALVAIGSSLLFLPSPRAADPTPPPPRRIQVEPDRPNRLVFPPTEARYIRVVIRESENGQPCFDELEVYGPGDTANLALTAQGSTARAGSCLQGYAIHQIGHLNDGRYGNDHSWIAAGTADEWAQIVLPRSSVVDTVVFSRDRSGRFRDRLPTDLEVHLSLDGQQWTPVCRAVTRIPRPASRDPEELLRYAFLCEQETWGRIDPTPPAERVLRQMTELADRLAAKGVDVQNERDELNTLRQRLAQPPSSAVRPTLNESQEAICLEARAAKRRLFLRDPDLAPLARILFVARQAYEPSHNYSDILDARWRPGGGIRVLDIPIRDGRLDPSTATVSVLFDAGAGVARDPMPSADARRVYFAYRTSDPGYYHLQTVNADGTGLRTLTEGPFHDYYPCPLPDGGLAFISTRCRARFLCWRPQAFVLFRMDADGGNVRALSHANLSEWAPSVMRDGRILWTRSEYLDKGADFGHTLWAIRPDGTHPELIFGNNTLCCYMNGREVPGTDEICCTLISHGGDLNGPIALVDVQRGRFNPSAITNLTPDCPPRYHMTWAQRECFRDPIPIARDLILVSHAPQDHFGLYVIDRYGNRELLHLDPAIGSMSPTPLRPEPIPARLPAPDPEAGPDLPGVLVLQDVHRGLEPHVPRGTVKYLRVCQEVRADLERLPNGEYRQDHPPFEDFYASPTHLVRGPNGWPSYVAKASLGLVPVEPDGSATFTAPAGKVLYFQALDENLTEVQRMRSVLQLQPGERRGCIGCHEHRSLAAPARSLMALRRPPAAPEPPSWGTGPIAYERQVQPVWDTHCVRCHDASDPRHLDFTGTRAADRIPASYRTLITQGWVHYFDYTWGQEHHKADPLTFGTVRSRLWTLLDAGHYDVRLSRDEMHRVKCWIDLNCPLWPDYIERTLRPGPNTPTTLTAAPTTSSAP
ncbi:MAG TPA: hypothetical protein PKM73_03195 [Verrucomicrobiota bacterium]|nr:hypothetical protein [Verrucomicrobiota bacterium]HNU50785.1 hypothetical protein [Verrucomicrobiota bacterium]